MIKDIVKQNDFLEKYEQTAICGDDFCLPQSAVFIKEDEYNGKIFWGIYDAEGTRLAVTEDRACAFELARQNDYQANSVH